MRSTARQVVVDFAELSDPGLDPTKQVNEDACAFVSDAHGHLAVVCDGMGGHASGREASQAAIRAIVDYYGNAPVETSAYDLLEAAIAAAGSAVYDLGAQHNPDTRPGATCVAALIAEPGVRIAHVGDSRAVLVRGGGVFPLTRDHSLVQELLDAGLLTPVEAKHHPDANKITRALGMSATVRVDVAPTWHPLREGDVLVLMTDGVSDLVPQDELRDVIRDRLALGPAVVCREVIDRVNARGGHDNATLQVLHVIEAPRRTEAHTVDGPESRPRLAPGGTQVLGTTRWSQAPAASSGTLPDLEPEHRDRATEPQLSPVPFPADDAARPWPATHATMPPPTMPLGEARVTAAPPPAPASPLRSGLIGLGVLAAIVALTALLTLFVRLMRGTPDLEPPRLEAPPAPSTPSAVVLVADPEPPASVQPSVTPTPSASTSHDAAAPAPSP